MSGLAQSSHVTSFLMATLAQPMVARTVAFAGTPHLDDSMVAHVDGFDTPII